VTTVVQELVAGLQVQPVGDDRFSVTAPTWFDDERVFGGVVVAHALNAALQTVDDSGVRPHSFHGYFLRPVLAGADVELTVDRLRDGRSFSTRHVTVSQDGRASMWAAVSFHRDEAGDDYRLPMPPDVPAPDGLPASEWGGPFDAREAGPVLAEDGTFRSTRRVWVRLPGPLPDDPAVHATLAGYLSDMTGTSFRPLSLGEWGRHTDASLDHALWLHRPFRLDEWLFFDLQAVFNGGGRSVVRGSLYTADGVLCLSMMQELLIREL
jgi:acyl-CoA thioesterase-2